MTSTFSPELGAELMLRVQAGDDAGFALLLEHYRRPVIRFLFRMVQDPVVAEDLAQDVFLRVYRARASYRVSAKFSAWLFRIAVNRAINWRRDVRRERDHECADEAPLRDRKPTIEQTLVHQTRIVELRRAIRNLPERQRAAVLMHKYDDLDYSQIARALSCSESAVKSLLFRAYEQLRRTLAPHEKVLPRFNVPATTPTRDPVLK